MKTNEERLKDILKKLDSLSYIKPEQIPGIDLYMDQLTTFMDEHLQTTKRNPEDKVLTKTMINNYAKNNLLPPPNKKKYSKEHILLLVFIYYFKNLLSFSDIEQLFSPITRNHFRDTPDFPLPEVYEEIFSLERDQMINLKKDVIRKFKSAENTFQSANEDDREYLQLFSFISELAFDVYLKKQMIEQIIDQLREEQKPSMDKKKR
ncbi:MAG: DUF1836 domain-containing protein [Lachnospiraceae bacterium]